MSKYCILYSFYFVSGLCWNTGMPDTAKSVCTPSVWDGIMGIDNHDRRLSMKPSMGFFTYIKHYREGPIMEYDNADTPGPAGKFYWLIFFTWFKQYLFINTWVTKQSIISNARHMLGSARRKKGEKDSDVTKAGKEKCYSLGQTATFIVVRCGVAITWYCKEYARFGYRAAGGYVVL